MSQFRRRGDGDRGKGDRMEQDGNGKTTSPSLTSSRPCRAGQDLYRPSASVFTGRIMSATPPLSLSYFLPETSRQGPSIHKAFQIAQTWMEFVLGSRQQRVCTSHLALTRPRVTECEGGCAGNVAKLPIARAERGDLGAQESFPSSPHPPHLHCAPQGVRLTRATFSNCLVKQSRVAVHPC